MTRTRNRTRRRPQRPKLRYPATERRLFILLWQAGSEGSDI